MMTDPPNSHASGHDENPAPEQPATRPSGQERQEQYQRSHEQPASDKDERIEGAVPDTDNNLSRGAPEDREERVRERAHEMEKLRERSGGTARNHGDRSAQDLDREDAEVHRAGADGEKPGIKAPKDST
jgi:hypothetical protein